MPIFLTLNEKGETPGAHPSEERIEVLNCSFGCTNPVLMGAAGTGAGATKATVSEFTLTKKMDTSSARLFQVCLSGERLNQVVIIFTSNEGPGREATSTITLTEVSVVSYQWSDSAAEQQATEVISLAFQKISLNFNVTTQTGQGMPTTTGWDLTKGMPT